MTAVHLLFLVCGCSYSCHLFFSAQPSLVLTTTSLFHMLVCSFFQLLFSSSPFPLSASRISGSSPPSLSGVFLALCVVCVSAYVFVKERERKSFECKGMLCWINTGCSEGGFHHSLLTDAHTKLIYGSGP